MMAGKELSEEQIAEMEGRYRAGEGLQSLTKEYHISRWRSEQLLKQRGVKLRSISEAVILVKGSPQRFCPSPAALRALYWDDIHEHPSISEVARRCSVSPDTVKGWLKKYGIPRRTPSQQHEEEHRFGRQNGPDLSQFKGNHFPKGIRPIHRLTPEESAKGRKESARRSRRTALRRQIKAFCYWCGNIVARKPHEIQPSGIVACGNSHAASTGAHLRYSAGQPRPLILARLRDLLRDLPAHRHPFTEATVSTLGATIGAQEPEIQAVWQEVREEQEALARVLAAPPMLPGSPSPKKPRQQPALTPETLGPVGEAILRAERQHG